MRGPAAARGGPARARRARPGRAPAAGDADPEPRRRLRHRGTRPGRARRRAGQVRQRGAAQGGAGRSRRMDREGRAAVRRGSRGPPRRRALAPPLGRLRAVGLAGRRARRHRGTARGGQRAAAGDARGASWPGHHRGTAARGGRRARTLVAVRRAAGRGRRAGRGRGGARGARRGAGRGQPAGGARAGQRAAGGAGRPVARRVRRTRREGRAAGGARRRTRCRAARLGEAAAPGRAGRQGAGRQPGAVPGDRRGRHPAAVAAGQLRPGAGGRAVHRAGRAAAAARGPLAPASRGPGQFRSPPAGAAAHRARLGARRRRGRLCHLLPAPRRDPGGRRRCAQAVPGRRTDRRPAAAARRPRARRGAGHPVVAASARHRRDVPGADPQDRRLTVAEQPRGTISPRAPGSSPSVIHRSIRNIRQTADQCDERSHLWTGANISAPDMAGLGHGRADQPQHPVRRLRPPGGGGQGCPGRRLAPRRRHGQPLRPQPHARRAGGGVPGPCDGHPAGLPPDDRGPRPLGPPVRGGGRLVRHLPRGGGRRPGASRPRDPRQGRARLHGAQAGDAHRAVRGPAAGTRHAAHHDRRAGLRRPGLPRHHAAEDPSHP
ncbi:hypothetical protein SGPA1_20406 [Streptomyces misionensis JCM 4497]